MTNVALVVLDTLRTDAFERHFDWLPGRRFSNAYSTSHWTVPAHASLFTGRYPGEVGVCAGSQHLDCKELVLAEQLRDAGYTTRALSTNVNVSSIYGFDRGFEEFESLGRHNRQLRQVSDPDLFDWSKYVGPDTGPLTQVRALWDCLWSDCATLPSLREGFEHKFGLPGRFGSDVDTGDMGGAAVLDRVQAMEFGDREFLFLNLMETHRPYSIPESYCSIESFQTPDNPVGKVTDNVDIEPLQTRYDEAANYLSDIYRDIFEELQRDFDHVITLSDHGELLGEHGYTGHSIGIYPELTRVPIVVSSEKESVEEGDRVVNLLDVYETVLDMTQREQGDGRGNSLVSSSHEDQPALTEYHGTPHPNRTLESLQDWLGSTDEAEKYQEWRRGFAFENGYYGYETINGYHENGAAPFDEPEKRIASLQLTPTVQRPGHSSNTHVSESVQKELEHLGYI